MIRKGFTLVELLVVMAVLAVLASGLIVAINPADKIAAANDTKVQNDISQIAAALVAYSAANSGDFPAVLDGLNAAGSGDLTVVPSAPTNYTAYAYVVDNTATPPTAQVGGQLKAKKYTNASTPAWVWCSSVAKAGPTATTATCP